MTSESPLGGVAREVLTILETVLTRAAIGAARTAVKVGSMARRHETIEQHAREVEQVTVRMRGDLEGAARAAGETADASSRVAGITRDGREVSARSLDSVRTLLAHTDATNQRLRSLLGRMREVTGVSRLIGEIAARTRLLALNAAIEATRAGASGRAFNVVASEVRDLAKSTAAETHKIDELVSVILADLEPARAAMEDSRALAATTAESVQAVDQQLVAVSELAEVASRNVAEIASTLRDQTQSMGTLAAAARAVVGSLGELREETRHIAEAAFAVADVDDEGHHQLARVELDTMFHHGLELCRELSERSGKELARPVDEGRITLDQLLALDYREIKGLDIAGLARLFDVSKVPSSGFTPPKYHTAYDALVDSRLQAVCDDVLGREPRLLFALPIDLNSYGPIHNRKFMHDWTGIPEKDLVGNRIKRFFTDNSVLVRGARVGLGPVAAALPQRATRADFQATRCDLTTSPRMADEFMVQTYARDTGAMVTVVTVPIFVRGHRWGAGLIGWAEEESGSPGAPK